MDLELFAAFDQGKLLPLGEIDRGFTRPTFPGQILLSYYHASKVIAFIAEAHGFDAVIAIQQHLAPGRRHRGQACRRRRGKAWNALDEAFRERPDRSNANAWPTSSKTSRIYQEKPKARTTEAPDVRPEAARPLSQSVLPAA